MKTHEESQVGRYKLNTRFIQKVINVSFLLLLGGVLTAALSSSLDESASTTNPAPTVSTDPYLGEIAIFPYSFAPQGWARCEGQLLAISQNTALFSLLGTTFGGNGQTTFALPDLRGRVVIAQGAGPGLPNYVLGQNGGATTHTLTIQEMPAHNHTVTPRGKNGGGDDSNPGPGRFPATASTDLYADDSNQNMGAATCANSGGSIPHNNMQPYLTVGYFIALQGVYPSQ